jgi:1,5-anhydro-D-fructose reductase (1,5-anhydro-D-mannitol-forming)
VRQVRWGIVGCGDVTEIKSGPAFGRVPGSRLQAVMRRDAAKARSYAERHGVPRWTADAVDIIEADDVDAVYVATPPSSHAEYVLAAARVGKPVLVEKPMARDAVEAESMVRACEAAKVPLFVAYYRRALPRFEFVRSRLEDGTIGVPSLVRLELSRTPPVEEVGWRWDPEVAGPGLLFDVGSHGLDLLDHWLGPIAQVSAFSATRSEWSRVPDAVVATLTFERDVLGTAQWDFAAVVADDAISITGTSGAITVPLLDEGPVRVVDARGAVTEHAIPHPPHVHEPLVASIVGELLGQGSRCPSTGTSALRTQVVLDRLVDDWRAREAGVGAHGSDPAT